MPLSALALVFAAALLHALWNVVAKRTGGDARFALMSALLLVAVWAPLGIWAGWQALPRWGWIEWAVLLASAVVHVVYFTTLLRGYRLADLTVVYPVARGTGPLLASLGAIVWLGERLTPVAAAGVAGVAIGVFFIAGGPALWARVHEPARPLDAGIVRALWLSYDEIAAHPKHRSPFVLRSLDDYRAGRRFPLGLISGF